MMYSVYIECAVGSMQCAAVCSTAQYFSSGLFPSCVNYIYRGGPLYLHCSLEWNRGADVEKLKYNFADPKQIRKSCLVAVHVNFQK